MSRARRPAVTAIEAELHKIFDAMGQPDYYIKFELRGLQRGDFKGQMAGYKDGVYAGILKRSEPREWMDLPFEEGSDELLQPTAYYSVDPSTGEPKPVPKALAAADPFAPLLADARERIALRVAKDGDTSKTREFARTALVPIAAACATIGRAFDIAHEIEESVNVTS